MLKLSRIDKQKIHSQNHGKLSPKSKGIVIVIVSTLKKWPRFLRNLSRTLNCAAGPRSQNSKTNYKEVFQYSNAMLFLISSFVLRAKNRGICCGSDLESQTELRIGLDLKNTPLNVLQTMDTNCKRPKLLEQQCLSRNYQCDI